MAIDYQGRDIQQQSGVGLRLEDIVSYDYSAYDSGSGQGAVEIINRWLVADNLLYSSSIEFDKDSGGDYSASYFLPTVINISGAFYGILSGSGVNISGSFTTTGTSSFYGPVTISGSTIHDGYIRLNPVTTNIDNSISASYIYVSGSTNDLYFTQNGQGYSNTSRLRWLESNLYTGIFNGGLITTQSSTVYQIGSGSGVIVNLNASFNTNPYPTVQYINWDNLSASIAPLSASYDQSFVAINSSGSITAQGIPYTDGQYNTSIPIGIVLHQNHSTINAVQTFPSVAYGWKQRSFDFIKAFGPLKISGYTLAASGSSTGSLVLSGGTSWVDGRNYIVDPNSPSYIVEANGITTSKIYRYYQTGSTWGYNTNGGAGYATIDPSQYSNNGVLTSVSTNNWTIQRVYYFPNSATKAFYIYYGNAQYANQSDALAAVSTETFSEAPNTTANAIYVGYMLLRHNANFTVPASYAFYAAGLFRASGVGGGGSSGGGTTPGGSTTQIQYNNAGAFAGSSNFTFNGTDQVQITGSLIVSGGAGTSAIDTVNGFLIAPDGNVSMNFNSQRTLENAIGTALDWQNYIMYGSEGNNSIDWTTRLLTDSSGANVFDYENRVLYTTSGNTVMSFASDYRVDKYIYELLTKSLTAQENIAGNNLYAGDVITGTIDASANDGDIMYLHTDGTWYPLKNLTTVSTKMVGICAKKSSGNVLIEGDITVSDDNSLGPYVAGANYGLPVYISGTTGDMTTTVPTSGVVRVLGHIYYRSTTDTNWWIMKFRPSADWYEI